MIKEKLQMKLNTVFSIRRFATAAVLALSTVGLHAEGVALRVTIPFAFTVSGTAMPAGEYTIRPLTGYPTVVSLHNAAAKANVIALATADSYAADKMTLTFDETKALSTVSAPGWAVVLPVMGAHKLASKRVEMPGVAAAVLPVR